MSWVSSCHDIAEYADNPEGNFEALWSILDEHYCFFEYKDVDWQEIKERYQKKNQPHNDRRGAVPCML